MNSFETHGIRHLSPSTINAWCQSLPAYLMKLAGYQDNEGIPAMWRGSAVDTFVGEYLLPTHKQSDGDGLWIEKWHGTKKDGTVVPMELTDPKSEEQLIEIAFQVYEKRRQDAVENGAPYSEEKYENEKKNLPRYLTNALGFYKSLADKPIAKQKFVKCFLPSGSETWQEGDVIIPFLGYIDLEYPDHVRDTKAVGNQSKKLTTSNRLQLSFYSKATNKEGWIDNIGKNDAVTLRVEADMQSFWINRMVVIARTMQNFLSISEDTEELLQYVFPDFDSYFYSDKQKEFAKEIWK